MLKLYYLIFMIWLLRPAKSAQECLGSSEVLKNGQCYFLVESKLNYHESRQNCKTLGGQLFEPLNIEINDFVYQSLSNVFKTDFWIGIRDAEDNFAYDSNRKVPLKFKNWNNKLKHCVQMTVDGKWKEASCQGDKFRSICQWRAKTCITGFWGSKMCF